MNKSYFGRITFNEKGGAAFYTLYVLPITMILLMIVVDISRWQSVREEARRELDRIVLESAQYLPFKADARNVFSSQATFFNASNSSKLFIDTSVTSLDNSIQPGKVTAQVTGAVESGFDTLLEAVTGSNTSFPVSETAQARLLPSDYVVIFSDSINLRPSAPSLWGNPIDWPKSEYFNLIPPPTLTITPSPEAPYAWPNWYSPSEFTPDKYMRFATQLCHNPVYTPLKMGVLLAVDSVSVNPENRLSIITAPGDVPSQVAGGPGYTIIKDLLYSDEANSGPIWSNYFEPDNAHCDEACVLYSVPELGNSRYVIPETSTFQSQQTCAQIVEDGLFSDARGHYPNPYASYLTACFKSGGMTARDAVYYHGVRRNSHEANAENIARAIEFAVGKLVEVEKSSALVNSQKRGGLSKESNKIVLVVSEMIPPVASPTMQRVLTDLQSVSNLKIYMLGYYSPELNPILQQDLNQRKQDYLNVNPRLEMILTSPDNIQANIISIMVNERRVVLAS